MLAHNILYTYIAPFRTSVGIAQHVDLLLLIFGITALSEVAGNEGVDMAMLINTTVWNLAIADGGIAGGILLEVLGTRSFPWAMFIILIPTLLVAGLARKHGFTSKRRI